MLESCSSLMACISCGVITRAWLCRISSRCESAIDRLIPELVRFLLVPTWNNAFLDPCTLPNRRIDRNGEEGERAPQERRARTLNRSSLQPEFFTQVEPAHIRVVDDL